MTEEDATPAARARASNHERRDADLAFGEAQVRLRDAQEHRARAVRAGTGVEEAYAAEREAQAALRAARARRNAASAGQFRAEQALEESALAEAYGPGGPTLGQRVGVYGRQAAGFGVGLARDTLPAAGRTIIERVEQAGQMLSDPLGTIERMTTAPTREEREASRVAAADADLAAAERRQAASQRLPYEPFTVGTETGSRVASEFTGPLLGDALLGGVAGRVMSGARAGLAGEGRAIAETPAARAPAETPAARAPAEHAPIPPAQRATVLQSHLDAAANAIRSGDLATAERLLTDSALARRLGLSLDMDSAVHVRNLGALTPAQRADVMNSFRQRAMSMADGRIRVPELSTGAGPGYLEMPEIAGEVMRVRLEEWAHQLQRLRNGPLSPTTQRFMHAQGMSFEGLAEADIQAAFRDWRLPMDHAEFASRYPERGLLERWRQQQPGH